MKKTRQLAQTPTAVKPIAQDVAKAQKEAAQSLVFVRSKPEAFAVFDADSRAFVEETLAQVKGTAKRLAAMRDLALKPLKQASDEIRAWFAPVLNDLAALETELKKPLGAYAMQIAEAERQARRAALAAVQENKPPEALHEALDALAEAEQAPPGLTTTRFVWRVKRIDPAALPREFLVPDVKKLNALARAHKGDEAPVVPGVTFEREADVYSGAA